MEQISPLQPIEDPVLQQMNMSWRKLQPVEKSPHRSRLLAGAVALGGQMLEQSVPERLYSVEGPMLEQVLKNCSL